MNVLMVSRMKMLLKRKFIVVSGLFSVMLVKVIISLRMFVRSVMMKFVSVVMCDFWELGVLIVWVLYGVYLFGGICFVFWFVVVVYCVVWLVLISIVFMDVELC